MKLVDLFSRGINKYPEFVLMYRYVDTNGLKDLEIIGITDDSRKVKPGYLFVAIKGLERDGHEYIEQAIEKGAAAVVFDVNFKFHPPAGRSNFKNGDIPMIAAKNTRRSLGLLWAAWFGFPSEKLKVIGITGTDGKTTTTNLLYHILQSAGKRVGMISTISARLGNKEVDTGFHVTSPEPELLQKLLSQMVTEGLEYVCLEVTSHGIDQERIAGVNFYGAVVTNVTHEHLDYHKTYQNYLETKGRLFKDVIFSVLNKDDESFPYLLSVSSGKKISYSLHTSADISADNVELVGDDSKFRIFLSSVNTTSVLYSIEVRLKLPGGYNISNSLASASAALELGLTLQDVKVGLENFSGLEGRFEEIKMGQPFRVVVDFAHTPNALERVLEQSLKFKNQKSKLIVVYGCAGERDKEKRAMMGKISGKLANISILTAEDPRREDLGKIIDEISLGCLSAGAKEISNLKFKISNSDHYFIRILDRRIAIEEAIHNATEDDIVIITGKGHEKSMCFGTTEYPWSDQEAVRSALKDSLK